MEVDRVAGLVVLLAHVVELSALNAEESGRLNHDMATPKQDGLHSEPD